MGEEQEVNYAAGKAMVGTQGLIGETCGELDRGQW